jgi:Cu/Ag efflux protein CusF
MSAWGPGSLTLALLLLAGCAGYQLAPLTTGHPAHPDAPTAPPSPPSQTLAYGSSDVPSAQPVASASAPPEPSRSGPATEPGARTVVGQGEVVKTVPASGQIVLDHEEIKGFMEAMTMGYRVDPPSLLSDVKEGDKIRFTIDVQRRAIVKIEKLP